MFANTITLTVNSIAKTLTRVNQDNFGSTYKYTSATELIQLQFRNSAEQNVRGVIDRHNLFIEWTVLATPTTPEYYVSASSTLRARRGTDPAMLSYLSSGTATILAANLAGLIQGES
ncbi:coat protein [ssRNA phage Gephyllon.1_28]|uniref:Coat protein n=2 Tax=Leviviricetes TaxID=2842243 RepID=A0A8S5L3D2_9VIRU|nr:coat protein [ssRNA phage Gephyllon.1_28]QDH88881.1 MAG: hypothetical protein H1BulkLitter6522_000002 [Leviviridae sp.]DAD51682.1 TPA_asm: coat protein [ssRNA phage Gephyllon.1_28]